jgi:hypothetical protein
VVDLKCKQPPKRFERAKRKLVLSHEPDVKSVAMMKSSNRRKARVAGDDTRSWVSDRKVPNSCALFSYTSFPNLRRAVIVRYGRTELPSFPVADTFIITDRSFVHFKTQNVIWSPEIAEDIYQHAIFPTNRDFQILVPPFEQLACGLRIQTGSSSRVKRIGLSGKPVSLSLSKFHQIHLPRKVQVSAFPV